MAFPKNSEPFLARNLPEAKKLKKTLEDIVKVGNDPNMTNQHSAKPNKTLGTLVIVVFLKGSGQIQNAKTL